MSAKQTIITIIIVVNNEKQGEALEITMRQPGRYSRRKSNTMPNGYGLLMVMSVLVSFCPIGNNLDLNAGFTLRNRFAVVGGRGT